ncbi:YHS domain-containing (seleno)protein [Halobacteriovorax sp. JY17]|uniref:YHS domain-containing (seleno)protein n=1 Tax=Halobacteriovorax sp. JY17 TaxID=2014617 RepID=UPI000C3BD1E0|nr:YHS domain-containing (seleno)protein [Halobacteriovorax sp. JY17]PIK13501.1 MAG: YHS domain protein [Halobacteriovorax sp. JY17]
MKTTKLFTILAFLMLSTFAFAVEENALPALRGYDAISYHTIGRPVMGNGNHVSEYKGQQYLFINKENKAKFDGNPKRYAPAFGGWCAFGVSVNKKFHADPLVWEIVKGKLYVNLDNKIKGMWMKDISGNISKANTNWKKIRNRDSASL